MAKQFLEELLDELNDLNLEEMQRLHAAVENRERPPLVMKPSVVMKRVFQVAKKHQITSEELMMILGSHEASPGYVASVIDAASQLPQEDGTAQ